MDSRNATHGMDNEQPATEDGTTQGARPMGQRLRRALVAMGGGVRAGWRELDPGDRVHSLGRRRTRQLRRACSRGAARLKAEGERVSCALRNPELKQRVQRRARGSAERAKRAVNGTALRIHDSKWVTKAHDRYRGWIDSIKPGTDDLAQGSLDPHGDLGAIDPTLATHRLEFTPPGVDGPTAPMAAWGSTECEPPQAESPRAESSRAGAPEPAAPQTLEPTPLHCPSCGERALGGLRKRMLAPGVRVACRACGETLSVGTVPGILAGIAVGGLAFLMGVAETPLAFFAAPILILALDRWWVHGVNVVRATDPSCRPFDRWAGRKNSAATRRAASA